MTQETRSAEGRLITVPAEPTEEMITAAIQCLNGVNLLKLSATGNRTTGSAKEQRALKHRLRYKAMLAAAPEANAAVATVREGATPRTNAVAFWADIYGGGTTQEVVFASDARKLERENLELREWRERAEKAERELAEERSEVEFSHKEIAYLREKIEALSATTPKAVPTEAIDVCIRVRDQLAEEGNQAWHGAQRCVMALRVNGLVGSNGKEGAT